MTELTERKLTVGSPEQKLLFYAIVKDLILKGPWKNARPVDQAKYWDLKWDEVSVTKGEGQKLGRNFFVKRDRYAITDQDVVAPIADHALFMVRLARLFPDTVYPIIRADPSMLPSSADEYYALKKSGEPEDRAWLDRLQKAGVTDDMIDSASHDDKYGMRQLMQDLRVVREAMKTWTGD